MWKGADFLSSPSNHEQRTLSGTSDMLARPCFAAAEQLCGEGTLIYPEGKTQPGANFAHPGANFRGVGSPGQAGRGVCECSNGPLGLLPI